MSPRRVFYLLPRGCRKRSLLRHHGSWGNTSKSDSSGVPDDQKTQTTDKSIAVGDGYFVESIKQQLGLRAKGVKEAGKGYQLREGAEMYIAYSAPKIETLTVMTPFWLAIIW